MKIAVVVLGKPSSGKDTQAELLAKKFNLVWARSSKIIKKALYKTYKNRKNVIFGGKKFDLEKRRYEIETGLLVKPEFVIALIEKEIRHAAQENKGIVFSGSARTLPEARKEIVTLDRLYGPEKSFYIYLDLPDKTAVKRAVLRNRADGLDKLIKKRIKVFYKETGPVLKLLKKQKRLIVIDGQPSVQVIFKDILKTLKS